MIIKHSILLLTTLLSGCATIVTETANLSEKPDGVRVFPQIILLAVDEDAKESTIFSLPDSSRAYDIKPLTILAKHEFNIKLNENGGLSELTSNQDTTAILTFLKDVADVAAKSASSGLVSSQSIKGTFGLKTGMYKLADSGKFIRQ